MLAEMPRKFKKDDSLAVLKPCVYLPGLDERVNYNSKNRILTELKSQGLTGPALRGAYLSAYETLKLESSIFAHEGRHAIDAGITSNLRSEELEFRAKLSEIYFSQYPFLSLTAVLAPNIGDGTSHGEANKRVLQGIINWMEKQTGNIDGLDQGRPMLPQLDLLTDAQLKSAVNSFDPMVN